MIAPAIAPTVIPAVVPGLIWDVVDGAVSGSAAVGRGGLVDSNLVIPAVGTVFVFAPVSFAVLVRLPVAVGIFGSHVVSKVDQRWYPSLDDPPW